ncbi:enoyl-CoA hydratase/isomerase family protein [Kyrpidia tusciae]|uniref:Enoyl-CoA hydratase/isomerase n=1 Tax=Kyrpidia tusciae (strain DSM 2912 / NBRC 15312 / T2) TaxID=562970 RepID=D5WQ29_KYRT2|nr:enoyl-CoA hydratase-related protein [Kyrpidia tusciae]ADG06438.1 Enoyl-CoA hydratase/isomerase [Kyrpidia tusciae DSM 2912]
MDNKSIVVELNDRVAIIRLNKPEMRNALTEDLTRELIDAIRRMDEDPDVGAMVLTGMGKAFCAGGDLNEFKKNIDKSAPQLYEEGLWSTELFKLGAVVRTPLIAAVNGPALGGGCGLVAMCHVALASDRAILGTTELKLGLVPYVILPWIRRAVGHRRAMEMMLSAEVLTAEQAERIGLVHRVVPHEQLEEEALTLARRIASLSPLAVRLGLDAFYTTEQIDLLKSFDVLSTQRIVSFLSEDLREGATAFLERRPPEWKGR